MNKSKKICLIVNGNYNIGLGHVYRVKTIAITAIEKQFEVLILLPKDEHSEYILSDFKTKIIDTPAWENPSKFINIYKKVLNNYDIILLDLLEIEYKKFYFLIDFSSILVSITSFYYSEKNRYEDISFFPGTKVINKSVIISNLKRIKLYSGPKYLTFREEFQKKFIKRFDEYPPQILITMGGTDPYELTPLVVESLFKLTIDFKANIILGKGAKTYYYVKDKIKNYSNINIIQHTTSISKYIEEATIAVINGGLTRYEMALVGTPFIAISIHQTQFNITKGLTSSIDSINLGIFKNLQAIDITNAMNILIRDKDKRVSINRKSQLKIDSRGSNRILQILEEALINI